MNINQVSRAHYTLDFVYSYLLHPRTVNHLIPWNSSHLSDSINCLLDQRLIVEHQLPGQWERATSFLAPQSIVKKRQINLISYGTFRC
jgi:hypothetical protein